ncbi:MAG: hypothetical protein JWQ74_2385 [Marmoricola sp.]|nr:hypothetical protein [Marmoricola sp.]
MSTVGSNERPGFPSLRYADELALRAPDFSADADAALASQFLIMPNVMARKLLNRAARVILTLAIADLADLLHDAETGSGRSAMRSARSLIEHSINLGTVLDDQGDAERYLAHLELGKILVGRSDYVSPILDRKRRSAAKHKAASEAKAAEATWAAAVEKYGADFRRTWHPTDLASRARAQDLDSLYDAYRIASNVAHGSAAGSFGHFQVVRNDIGSYVAGRTPDLIPLALAVGSDAYFVILSRLASQDPPIVVSHAYESLAGFLGRNYAAVWDISRDFRRNVTASFQQRTDSSGLYMVFSRTGHLRWYLAMDAYPSVWWPVVEADDVREIADSLAGVIDQYRASVNIYTEGGQAALFLPGYALPHDPEKRSIPATAIFPRLIPKKDLLEWHVAVGTDADGNYEYSGSVIAPESPERGEELANLLAGATDQTA